MNLAIFRIEITRKNDPRGKLIKNDFASFGVDKIEYIEVRDIYYLHGVISKKQAERIASELLCDPVVEQYRIGDPGGLEILYNPGVTDPKEESIKKAISDLGITIDAAKTGTNYIIKGSYDEVRLQQTAGLFLFNPLVQHIKHVDEEVYKPAPYRLSVHSIDLSGDLNKISRDMGLFLSGIEMKQISEYFSKEGKKPTDVELESIAQTWSEHCRHKTFLGRITINHERTSDVSFCIP
jgi:phosphoribosylformylglycinamidine synthase